MKNCLRSLVLTAILVNWISASHALASGDGEVGVSATNAINFHLVDFVGWNNHDFDVLRHYHTSDVKVLMAGQYTSGIDAHLEMIQKTLEAMPQAHITRHYPTVVQGNWNCTVGIIDEMHFSMATIARFRDGAIAEEYVLLKQIQPSDKPVLQGKPLLSIRNTTPTLKSIAGVEQGWSCVLDRSVDGKWVADFTKKGEGENAVQELIFTE